jgi:hypothetical protein
MGLDMYAMATNEIITDEVDFEITEKHRFHYWRKHPNLHGWMEALYYEKGGTAESFNCVPVVLTSADLDRLEAGIRTGALPETQGFFFGISDGSETEDDLDFIGEARVLQAVGLTVYYFAWW